MERTMLALVFSLAFFLLQGADSTYFTFQNNCPYSVWPGIVQSAESPPLSETGFELPSGAAPVSLEAPVVGWHGQIWARAQCSTDSFGKFSCLSGDCGTGQVACNGARGATPTTLLEFILSGTDSEDVYYTSLVDGFNMPIAVAPQGGSGCAATGCPANVNPACPPELMAVAGPQGAVVGCKSACDAFNTDEYCCKGAFARADQCKPTKYSTFFKSECPLAYSYAYDGITNTFICVGPSSYLITFCPKSF